jgi:hypothetical protein
MPKRLARYLTMPAVAAATLMSIAFGGTAAHAATPADTNDQFGCPTRTVCVWSGSFSPSSSRTDFPTAVDHSRWISLNATAGYNPGSADDNSGSAVYLFSRATGAWTCGEAGEANGTLNGQYGYFFVTYNVPDCGSLPPGAP